MSLWEFLLDPFTGAAFALLLAVCALVLLFRRKALTSRERILIGAALLSAAADLAALTFLLSIIVGFSAPD